MSQAEYYFHFFVHAANLQGKIRFESAVFLLEETLGNHTEIAEEIRLELSVPVRHFQNHLQHGAYPYYNEEVDVYLDKLLQTLNLIVETDMNVVEDIPYEESIKIKKLLWQFPEWAFYSKHLKTERTVWNESEIPD